MTVLKSVTFDVNTGRIYRLEDLFKENVDYVKPLSDIIKRQIQERNIPLIVGFTAIKPDQDFYIQNRTLMIYFQLYELAPYVYGFVTFPIPTREIEDIIRKVALEYFAIGHKNKAYNWASCSEYHDYLFSFIDSHTAALKPTKTLLSPINKGRLTNIPSVDNNSIISSSVICGILSFNPISL